MEPRFRGGLVIFARSFARIHETNAKKQGLVPLTFADGATYDAIEEDDRINVLDLPPVPGQTGALPDRQARRHDDRLRVHPHVQPRAGRVVQGRQRPQHRAPEGRRRRVLTLHSRSVAPGATDGREPGLGSDGDGHRTALRTTGAARDFTDEPVSRATVRDLLDDARFAPSGGNRQPWRVARRRGPRRSAGASGR